MLPNRCVRFSLYSATKPYTDKVVAVAEQNPILFVSQNFFWSVPLIVTGRLLRLSGLLLASYQLLSSRRFDHFKQTEANISI